MDGKKQYIDMTGRKYGYLMVIRHDGQYLNTSRAAWLCRCECGVEWTVSGDNLRLGRVVSCGCKRGGKAIHGQSKNKIYHVWQSMKARCGNPNNVAYSRYGGRGIQVDHRWVDFENFLADMGEPPEEGMTIDRIDNDGDYTKSNCRWATRKQQANNTRRNVIIKTAQGSFSLEEAAKMVGITYDAMQKRLALGLVGYDLLLPKYSRLPLSTTS